MKGTGIMKRTLPFTRVLFVLSTANNDEDSDIDFFFACGFGDNNKQ